MRKMFYIVCIILMLCTACSSNTNSNNTDSELNNNPSNNQEVTEQVVYEDTYAKVVFQKLHEEPSIEGTPGTLYDSGNPSLMSYPAP